MEPLDPKDTRDWARDAGERVVATFVQVLLGGVAAYLVKKYTGDESLAGVVGLSVATAAAYAKALVAKRFGDPSDASLVE